MADKGCHAVTFSENPEKLGHPSWHSDHWDPFLAACEEVGTVICLHIGSSSQTVITAMDAPIDTMITLQPMNIVQCAADLVWSPVFRKFPEPAGRAERGRHRLGAVLPRADRLRVPAPPRVDEPGLRRQAPEPGVQREHPHLLHRRRRRAWRCATTSTRDHIHWECDYPHSDSTWPNAPEMAMKYLDGLPDDEIDRITHLNAMRNFTYDPFAHIPREQATVGALRAQATDVDTTPVSHGTGKFQDEGIVTAMTLAERIGPEVGDRRAPSGCCPLLDDENRFFWTSGEDGQLRFLRCQACGYYLHPPLPRCPECGGRDVAPEPVSGRGEVLLLHRQPPAVGRRHRALRHRPGRASPSRTGLRLTTNIVGLPARRRAHRHARAGRCSSSTTTSGSRCSSRSAGDRRDRLRAAIDHLGHRPVRRRSAAAAAPGSTSPSTPRSRPSPTPGSPRPTSTASPPTPAAGLGGAGLRRARIARGAGRPAARS